MTVRAEGSSKKLSRVFATFLGPAVPALAGVIGRAGLAAALLIPASGGLFPALAQVRVQTVPTGVNVPIAPVAGTPQNGTTLLSPAMTLGLAPALAPAGFNVVPTVKTDFAAPAAAASNVAQALPSGFQVLPADAQLPATRSVARSAERQAPRSRSEGPSAMESAHAAAGNASVAFDGMGILPSDKPHQPQLGLDPKPTTPKTGVAWSEVTLPEKRGWLKGLFGWVLGPEEAIVIAGNPRDEAGVERGLRELIRTRPDLFSNLSADSFRTRHVRKVQGQAGLSDSFYANFQQQKDTLPVEGSYLNFVVKVLGGRTVVVASNAELFPETGRVDTTGRLDEAQLRGKAAERLGTPPNASEDLRDMDRKVMFLGGQWRAVQVYFYEKLVVAVAVDINTGESFAWDPRMQAAPSGAQTLQASGASASGRGVAEGPYSKDLTLDVLPMAHLEISGPNGKFFTDGEGRFTVPGTGDQPVTLTARLTGRYATVSDRDNKDLKITVTAKPGEELKIVFNPEGMDENAVSQVNGYVHTTAIHDWVVAKGVNLQALNQPMPVYVNIDDECNAYYTPWRPSLNFFKSSSKCVNSAYRNVNQHEYGHAVDDAAGGIQNGGLSEGWGDIIAMYISGKPEIGKGFFLSNPWDPNKPPPPYLRTGTNDYKYNPRDEVHKQGEAWGGFAWKLRENLIASIGDPARAAALAEALVVPVILASVKDIPSAIQQVLLRDIDETGKAPHLKEIAAAAAAHGIKVQMPRAGQREGLFSSLAATSMSLAQAVRPGSEKTVEEDGTKNL